MGKVVSLQDLLSLRQQWRIEGKKLVLTNGCFDILHIGHVHYLQRARSLGDVLIVGVNSDASVKVLKGPHRPIMPQNERAEILASLESVDYVTVFEEVTAEALVKSVQPEVYVKGGDYGEGGKPLPEAEVVAKYGGHVVALPFVPERSTTQIIRLILERPWELPEPH